MRNYIYRMFKKNKYKFSDPENTACMVCNHVLENQSSILIVMHDEEDGMWQFLCGEEIHKTEDAKNITLVEASNIDPSINELYEMPLGVGATRESIYDAWQPFKN
jgi:hypothetical protein